MEIFLDVSEAKAIGDTIACTPTLRKLYQSYGKKVYVVSHHLEIFENNPYVQKCYLPNSMNIDFVKEKTIYHNSFCGLGKKNERGVEYKHNNMDIRQFHAVSLGFMLSPYEMDYDFVPRPYVPIDELPEKYVLIHPVQNWPSRTWEAKKWMELTKRLNEDGISVISVGKDSSETGFFNVNKPTFNFEISQGINMMNKTDLSQAWHLIDKSMCFITMDSGLLHLAGATDSEIIYLGSSIKYEFRAPYRNGSQTYKIHHVAGGCKINCASDMKYGVREWGSIQGIAPLIGCLEKKETFECHPSVEQVYHKIKEII